MFIDKEDFITKMRQSTGVSDGLTDEQLGQFHEELVNHVPECLKCKMKPVLCRCTGGVKVAYKNGIPVSSEELHAMAEKAEPKSIGSIIKGVQR